MATTSSAVELIRGLSAADIRRRLLEIEAEEKALRTLLRAAVQAERANKGASDGK